MVLCHTPVLSDPLQIVRSLGQGICHFIPRCMEPSELGHRAMVINATDRRALLLQTPTTPAHPAAPAAGQLRLGRGRGAFGQGRAEGRTGARRRASPPAGHCQAAPGPARRGAGAPRSPGRGGRRRPTARAPGAGPAASFRAQSTSVLRYGGSAGGAGGEGGVKKKRRKIPEEEPGRSTCSSRCRSPA